MLTARSVLAQAQSCPPAGNPPAKDVPGQPGEKGWLLGTEKDDKGNVIETWCLQAGNGHGGSDFGSLWRPAGGGQSVWIGACTFPQGVNRPNKSFEDKGPNGKPNGVPDEFTKVTWFNIEPPPSGANDWDYSFDPATGKLTIAKTKGGWGVAVAVNTNTGKARFVWVYTNSVIGVVTNNAPTNFSGLNFGGTQITQASGTGGRSGEGVLAALVNYSPPMWGYNLHVPDLGGTGTTNDPLVGLDVTIMAGDTFTLGGVDITDPGVTAPAASADYGGWVVDSFDVQFGTFVTYRATTTVSLPPDTDISGFYFFSRGEIDEVPWNLSSGNEFIGSSGTVQGPVLALNLIPGNGFLVLSWNVSAAVLQQADSVNGPWSDVLGAHPPYTVQLIGAGMFYRLRLGP